MPHSPEPPVILQILPALNAGGVERGTVEMTAAIVRGGGTALVASAGGRLVPDVEQAGGRHILMEADRKDPLSLLRNTRILRELILRETVSLIHARSRAPAWITRLACRSTGTPFLATWHGVHKEGFPGKKLWNGALVSGERVIAISDYIADRLAGRYGAGPDRLRVIPRGADTDRFSPGAVTDDRLFALARAWTLPDNAPVILMPGRLTDWKGQAIVLQALSRLAGTLPVPTVCVFAGEGPSLARLQQQAAQAGLSSQVRFPGHCSDMPAAFALATLAVVPSLRPEPFGRVVVEAQAMECPVIVTAHGAARETVIPGKTGLLIPPDDAEALATAIRQILTMSDEQRQETGRQARQHVLARYTTRSMQAATLGVYDEILGTGLRQTFLKSGEPSWN
ncbi:glycosyltransferase family 4 protein [Acetobacter sp. AN02]|uniref:glycosyltransferase family 4 protein n=1 Tax=Acetobacter sp. AN02 TaxID=2894186 RepID=UPI0024344AEC|nr:glycosyltransferase family 4 protein [Acetobacter sp. AN02]MDG6094126.1 glycosyltransferase family 4 protein [Acetobacter sp. AN02]